MVRDAESTRVKNDVYLVATEEKLGGKNRFIADGFLDSTECEQLMQLASVLRHHQIIIYRPKHRSA